MVLCFRKQCMHYVRGGEISHRNSQRLNSAASIPKRKQRDQQETRVSWSFWYIMHLLSLERLNLTGLKWKIIVALVWNVLHSTKVIFYSWLIKITVSLKQTIGNSFVAWRFISNALPEYKHSQVLYITSNEHIFTGKSFIKESKKATVLAGDLGSANWLIMTTTQLRL